MFLRFHLTHEWLHEIVLQLTQNVHVILFCVQQFFYYKVAFFKSWRLLKYELNFSLFWKNCSITKNRVMLWFFKEDILNITAYYTTSWLEVDTDRGMSMRLTSLKRQLCFNRHECCRHFTGTILENCALSLLINQIPCTTVLHLIGLLMRKRLK